MTDGPRTRRRFLATTSTGLLLAGAGCLTGSNDSQDGVTPTNTETATPTQTATETEESGPSEEDGPGYKDSHWHGRLFFEVDGELVDFDRPKYYLENIESDRPDTVHFHFHDDEGSHAPDEWSNEKKIITFERALNLLPDIGYEQRSGSHVVTYEGTTYDARKRGTAVSITEGDQEIDPTGYQVAHDDNYYVRIVTEDSKRRAEPAHGNADLGTLLFDLNNVRVDFSREKFLGPEATSDAFHFHDDGHPYMWYLEGSVTLGAALNALPGIDYETTSGEHVLTYDDDARPDYSRTYDATTDADDITIKQRTETVDPTSYRLRAGDIVWVHVDSEHLPKNEH